MVHSVSKISWTDMDEAFRKFAWADTEWEEALKNPGFLAKVFPEDYGFHKWYTDWKYPDIDPRIFDPENYLRGNKPYPGGPPKRRIRAADCSGWVKTNNYHFSPEHIRKRPVDDRRPKKGMPRPLTLAQYQRHCIHLISSVLSIRTNASPFTLILDDLNQRAAVLMNEFIRRALSRNINVVFVSFETHGFQSAIHCVRAYGDLTGADILTEVEAAMSKAKESIVIVDSLHDLLNTKKIDMNALFSLVVGKFASTLVGIYHQDMLAETNSDNPYAPQSLDSLKFMATTVITCRSFAHALAAKAAKERSLPEPTHGLLQGAEGIVQCLDANDHHGIVLDAEFRHKSGRQETESFFLRAARITDFNDPLPGMIIGTLKQEYIQVLAQQPAYANDVLIGLVDAAAKDVESSFNLGLTDKQRAARDGIILPYFDAQNPDGGEGGRILYDMGSEDDFDEEEDEI